MEEITGLVQAGIFKNEANGYAIIEVCNEETGVDFVAVGTLIMANVGERVRLCGRWVEHKRYGRQFSVNSFQILAPSTENAMESYLASGLIRGIGPATARQIIKHFGLDAFDIIEKEPIKLTQIPGIGRIKAGIIASSFMQHRGTRDIMLALQEYSLTTNQAMKIYKMYGAQSLEKLRENPYRMIDDIENVGFKTADKIAKSGGIGHDSEFRLMAGVKYTLEWARQEGHTCLPKEVLEQTAAHMLEIDEALIENALMRLITGGKLVHFNCDGVAMTALPYLRYKEANCANLLVRLAFDTKGESVDSVEYDIERHENNVGITLAPLQHEAVEKILTCGAVVITGGPGTGKTTILKLAINIMEERGIVYELAAPTGRAAKRMSEATGKKARTMHRLLEYSFSENEFLRGEDNPIEADVVIIDEMSMVDVPLMEALLKALDKGTRLVMVGDADQLPSVGAGNVLRDIINSGVIESLYLTEIYRQAEQSAIVTNAHRINNGTSPVFDNEHNDFSFENISDPNKVLERIVNLYLGQEDNPLFTNDPAMDVQVLAPMKKGILGVNNLNIRLRDALNPPAKDVNEHIFGETLFREGDKVMQIKNDYTLEWTRTLPHGVLEKGIGVFNGDIGTIMRIDKHNEIIDVLFDDGCLAQYEFSRVDEIEHSFCVSIHKSQGSEFPIVLMPLMGGPPGFMTRNLLYTAVTRAKNQVYILGSYDCINSMVMNNQVNKRYSALCSLIKEYASALQASCFCRGS